MKKQLDDSPSLLKGFTAKQSEAISWVMVINSITGGALCEMTQRYRATGDQQLKSRLPCITPACRLNGTGKEMADVMGLTGIAFVDLDGIPHDDIERVRAIVNDDPHTFASKVSVSGRGLHILARYEGNDYAAIFLTVNCHYSDLTGYAFDEKCSNVNRLMALNHDTRAYYNAHSTPFVVETMDNAPAAPASTMDNGAVDYAVRVVEKHGETYTHGNRHTYLMKCVAMMNRLGVSHSEALSWALTHDLGEKETRTLVKSVYGLYASQHGTYTMPRFSHSHILTPSPHAHTRAREGRDENESHALTCGGRDKNDTTPQDATELAVNAFPQYQWPRFLQQMVDCGDSKAQRDVILLCAITVLGSMLGKTLRFKYSHHYWYPAIQTFVTAPPASGKSCVAWTRRLAEPLHDRMIEAHDKAIEEYEAARAAYDCAGKEKKGMPQPKKPALSMFIIAGNNSASGILENLAEAKDHTALICESEADTISASISTDYGNWGDTLRKVHDHDRLSLNRRTNNEYRQIPAPCLAVLISGTPAQVKPLIPSAENGLFSRQLFVTLPAIDEFVDQFGDDDSTDYDSLFTRWGREWLETLDTLKSGTSVIELKLTAAQCKKFNTCFAQLFHHAGVTRHNHHMKSSVAREAINVLRVMSVVALLRALESGSGMVPAQDTPAENVKDGITPRLDLSIIDDDFVAVLSMAEPLYRTASDVLTLLPCTEAMRSKMSATDKLLSCLPLSFKRKDAVAMGLTLGVTETNIDTMLQRLVESGRIIKTSRGVYEFPARVCGREDSV